MKPPLQVPSALLLASLVGCSPGPKSGRGFRLPEGDVGRGKEAFVALHCHTCHQVDGTPLPPPTNSAPATFVLGGKVTRVRSYGELVTAVINPGHGLAPGYDRSKWPGAERSPMPDFNESMTVAQMIDLVAFLQSRYHQLDPAPYYVLP